MRRFQLKGSLAEKPLRKLLIKAKAEISSADRDYCSRPGNAANTVESACVDGGGVAAGREAGGIFTRERDDRSTRREKDAHLPVILRTQVSISAEFALASLFNLPILTQLDVRTCACLMKRTSRLCLDTELQSLPVCQVLLLLIIRIMLCVTLPPPTISTQDLIVS